MGIFKKKKLSPEELEEKSRKEKEWADKCYKAGEHFAEKYNLRARVERINELCNRYPKTFFIGMLSFIVINFLISMLVMKCSISQEAVSTDMNSISIQQDRSRNIVKEEINKLYLEMDNLNRRLENYLTRDSLTRDDSLAIGRIVLRMEQLNSIIEGKETAVQDSLHLHQRTVAPSTDSIPAGVE